MGANKHGGLLGLRGFAAFTVVYGVLGAVSLQDIASAAMAAGPFSLAGKTFALGDSIKGSASLTAPLSFLFAKSARILGKIENTPFQAVGDQISTTVKFRTYHHGIEILGGEKLFHYDTHGKLLGISSQTVRALPTTRPALAASEARQIIEARFGAVMLSEEPQLKIWTHSDGEAKLVYWVKTQTSPTHQGHEVFIDAQTGEILHELNRIFAFMEDRTHFHHGGAPSLTTAPTVEVLDETSEYVPVLPVANTRIKNTVYSASTRAGIDHRDARGFPTRVGLNLYKKVMEDGMASAEFDTPAYNAWTNAQEVYKYYRTTHERKSFDGEDSRMQSVVHMGPAINAFWSSEHKLMAYGDGDGQYFKDFSTGLDVTAHEMTHAVTSSSAELVYSGESGALNESYSDFFGKMVDYSEVNWDIGRDVMLPKAKKRAIRNMENPEEFGQPGDMESPNRMSTQSPCTYRNDYCGVHRNSGIPNRAAVLIVKGLGKEATEKLYFNVLTQRLHKHSDFQDARLKTEDACAEIYKNKGGKDSAECKVVEAAFDTVKIPRKKAENPTPSFEELGDRIIL